MEGLLSGRFFDEGAQVRIRLELSDMRNGNLIGSGDCLLSKMQIPKTISLVIALSEPKHMQTLNSLLSSSEQNPKQLGVSVSIDRGVGAAYHAGEYLSIFL